MCDNIKIRLATIEDSAEILSIYADYIKDTSITFETEVPSVADFGKRIEKVQEMFPWLVCEIDGNVVGYAYASKHRERAAYQWSADLSIYISAKYHRKHIATALYKALTALLHRQGYINVFAGVTVPNPNSEAFHTRFGFQTVGVFKNVGYKLGKWRDVKWFAMKIAEYPKEPRLPVFLQDAVDTKELEEILKESAKNIM